MKGKGKVFWSSGALSRPKQAIKPRLFVFLESCYLSSVGVCLCVFLCKKNKEKKSVEPQGEMVYLLQTASQGRSGREIKLQWTFEGVALNLRTYAFSIFVKRLTKKENITECSFVPCKMVIFVFFFGSGFRAEKGETKSRQFRSDLLKDQADRARSALIRVSIASELGGVETRSTVLTWRSLLFRQPTFPDLSKPQDGRWKFCTVGRISAKVPVNTSPTTILLRFLLATMHPRCGPQNHIPPLLPPTRSAAAVSVYSARERREGPETDNAAFQRCCRPHGSARKSAWGPANTPSPNFTVTRHEA